MAHWKVTEHDPQVSPELSRRAVIKLCEMLEKVHDQAHDAASHGAWQVCVQL